MTRLQQIKLQSGRHQIFCHELKLTCSSEFNGEGFARDAHLRQADGRLPVTFNWLSYLRHLYVDFVISTRQDVKLSSIPSQLCWFKFTFISTLCIQSDTSKWNIACISNKIHFKRTVSREFLVIYLHMVWTNLRNIRWTSTFRYPEMACSDIWKPHCKYISE